MALIKCPECGRQVSDLAESCPDCGFPVKEYTLYNQDRVGVYCPKCGNYFMCGRQDYYQNIKDKPCRFCGAQRRILPPDDKEFGIFFRGNEMRDHFVVRFVRDYVSKLPEFSQEAYIARLKQVEQNTKEFMEEWENHRRKSSNKPVSNAPKCPVCGSTNTSKIGVLGRSTSIFAFGLASNKIGKNWKCHSCGNTW